MDGSWPATITTQRLTLRPFTDDDKPVVLELECDEDVRRYLGGPGECEAVEKQLATQTLGQTWGRFAVVLTSTGEVAGGVSFDSERGDLDLGWLLLPRFWAQGIATEAVQAAFDWVFGTTDASRIIAVTQTANAASCRLAERIGMTEVERFEEFGAEQARYELERDRHAGRV